MKKILLSLFAIILTATVFAQKYSPTIKEGTGIYCIAYVQGQEIPLLINIKSVANPFVLAWSVDGYGDGTFEMSENAIAKGNKFFTPTQPNLGVTKLADDETFGMISTTTYQALVANKEMVMSGITFKLKPTPTPMLFGGKEIDATHLVGDNGKLEVWVLNNEKFPLILQTSGMSTDIVVVDIK